MPTIDAAGTDVLADLRTAVAHLHPDDPVDLVVIGDDLCALGSPAAAVPFYEAAIESGVPGAVYRLGVAHHDAGDVDEAARQFELAGLAGDENGAFMAAQVAHQRGDLHAALHWYELAQGVEGVADRLADVRHDLGDTAQTAIEEPEPGLEPVPRPDDAGPPPADWAAAVEHARSGALDLASATALLESWAEAGEVRVAAALAEQYVRAGRGLDAEDLLEQAVLAGDPAAGTSLGVMRLRAGQVPEAMELWRTAATRGDAQAVELLDRFG
ncbi:hypothetical protein IF650_01910 [Cellulosimicrobium terreum]|nr:hypothetical protein [Cellulosimicrobium terreum]